jgi:hypothetical protein
MSEKTWMLNQQKELIEAELKDIPKRLEQARKQEELAREFGLYGQASGPLFTVRSVEQRRDLLTATLATVNRGLGEAKEGARLRELEKTVLTKQQEVERLTAKRQFYPGVALEQQIETAERALTKMMTELKTKFPDSPVANPITWMTERTKKLRGY